MPAARYFELRDLPSFRETAYLTNPNGDHLDPIENPKAGDLAPFVGETLMIGIPTMVGKEMVPVPERVELKPMPGTRVLKITDPLVANLLVGHPHYDEIDPPKSEQPRKPKAAETSEENS